MQEDSNTISLDYQFSLQAKTTSDKKPVSQGKIGKSLLPVTSEIGTYTTDTVKIVGSCLFCLVHLDSRSYKKWLAQD